MPKISKLRVATLLLAVVSYALDHDLVLKLQAERPELHVNRVELVAIWRYLSGLVNKLSQVPHVQQQVVDVSQKEIDPYMPADPDALEEQWDRTWYRDNELWNPPL